MTTMATVDPETERQFIEFAEKWREATGFQSLMKDRVFNDYYQDIIGLGPRVVPILLRELQIQPDHWFHALRHITHENPALPEHRGNFQKIAQDWIQWGKANGFLNEEEVN